MPAPASLWRECAEVGMPRAVVITKLDQARADYDGVLPQAQAAFGDKVMPLYLPIRSGEDVTGVAGLLSPSEHADDELRGTLIEAVIEESEDETLMDRYLEGEEIAEEVLVADLERAVAKAQLPPGRPGLLGHRRRLRRAARPGRPAPSPRPPEHVPPDVFTPAGAEAGARSPATRTARWSPRSSRPPATRTSAGSASSGSSPARSTPDATVHVSGHFTLLLRRGVRAPGPRRGRADRRAVLRLRSHPGADHPRWSPATCARSAG